eukprot:s9978_g1.t1
MDFDLFGPSSGSPSAHPPNDGSTGAREWKCADAPVQLPVPPTPTLAADQLQRCSSSFGGRAEKYLPPLPLINHGEMKQGRIRELEKFHRFLEVLSSWLALTDDAFVGELRQCLFVPNEIQQVSLPG